MPRLTKLSPDERRVLQYLRSRARAARRAESDTRSEFWRGAADEIDEAIAGIKAGDHLPRRKR